MPKALTAHSLPTSPMRTGLSYRISILNALMGKRLSVIYTSRSLNTHQWKVLSVLYCWPPITAAGISGVVVLDRPAISRAIGSLVRLKLVERRHDPDSNSTIVVLTSAGRKLYSKMHAEFEEMQKEFLSRLSLAHQGQLFDALDVIEEVLRWPAKIKQAGKRERAA
jgi:DNA-binding MarR family transcriptional regulator